jgi:CRP-like cAMP-binding protein
MDSLDYTSNHFLSRLASHELDLLRPHFEVVELRLGESVYRSGEEIAHVVFPRSGLIMSAVTMENGMEVEAALVGREGLVGGLAGYGVTYAFADTKVRVPGNALRVPTDNFRDALDQSAHLRRLVALFSATMMLQSQQSTACSAIHSVEQRMSRWLLDICDRVETGRLPLTQDLLARMLGVRRTTITLVAGRLQADGALRCQRGFMHITDRDLLERRSCGCYRQVKESVHRLMSQHAYDASPDLEVQSESPPLAQVI